MAVGALLEPLAVVTLLFGGAWFNRNKDYGFREGKSGWAGDRTNKKSDDVTPKRPSSESLNSTDWGSSSTPTLTPLDQVSTLRRRKLQIFGYKRNRHDTKHTRLQGPSPQPRPGQIPVPRGGMVLGADLLGMFCSRLGGLARARSDSVHRYISLEERSRL